MKLEEFSSVSLFCERKKHPNYNIYFTSLEHWASLYRKCERLRPKVSGPPFAIFHTELLGQFIMRDCEFTFALSVEQQEGCDKISRHRGFLVATAIHKGSYLSIINTYIRLLQWINTTGYEAQPPTYEQFIISPLNVSSRKC
ncbi:MAG: hypothetical protein HFE83_10200 [Lachnospiraceae bacterium]|jgi:hypothetical protein|nr:hypothetical protein [Lachnospiraceae bacterium]